MKTGKRAFALLCALALTLTLCPAPVRAADTLSVGAAFAFYGALRDWEDANQFVRVELRDMDADGQPEIVALTSPGKEGVSGFFMGDCVVWKYVPGVGVRRRNAQCNTGPYGGVYWAQKDGQLYVECQYIRIRYGNIHMNTFFMNADGIADEVSFFEDSNITGSMEGAEIDYDGTPEYRDAWSASKIVNGRSDEISYAEYMRILKAYQDAEGCLSDSGVSVSLEAYRNDKSYDDVLKRLRSVIQTVSAAPSGEYGPCRLQIFDSVSLYFESARLERKTVSVKEVHIEYYGEGENWGPHRRETGYQSKTVSLVTAAPDSALAVIGGEDGYFYFGLPGSADGDGRFSITYEEFDEPEYRDGVIRDVLWNREKTMIAFADRNETEYFLYAVPGANVRAYTDIQADAYYAVPVSWGIARGVTNGTSATTFSPNNTCTRAQILTFLWRACGSPAPDVENPFPDVAEDSYYYQAAVWAAGRLFDVDFENHTKAFDGGTPCSRAEAVRYLWRLSGQPDEDWYVMTEFTDVANGTETARAVNWAVTYGITKGTTETTFSPENICTRAQIMTFLYRDDAI